MALTPEQLAEIQRLKALMQPAATQAKRKAQAIFNAEKGAGQPVRLPTDKAEGGTMDMDAMRLALMNKGGQVPHLAIGGQGPRNWMKGMENVTNPLKQFASPTAEDKAWYASHRAEWEAKPESEARTQALEAMDRDIKKLSHDEAVNNWVDRNLVNYIRKQMASPDDPVRTYADKRHSEIEAKHAGDLARIQKITEKAQTEADPRKKDNLIRQSAQMRNDADNERRLAMDHILHMPNEQIGTGQYLAHGMEEPDMHRRRHGGEQLAKTEAAKAWEDATDVALGKTKVGDVLRLGQTPSMAHQVEPWMEKADPASEVFHPTDNMHAHYLGFDHILDILKQDLAEGRITPEQLNKVSMEQAVRRASEYNLERTKTMEAAKLKRDEGMPVHKDYGDGNKWIELAFDDKLPEGWSKSPSGTYVSQEGKSSIHHPNRDKLEDALKYEGDTMGHCVGGYTNKVMRGESRVYSLRDKRNEPHVTIEVTKGQPRTSYEEVNAIYDQANNEADEKAFDTSQDRQYFYQNRVKELQDALLDKKADAMPPKIQQIYGKSNKKPKKEYIPFIQDFVKGGEWSDVLTAQNAEVVPIGNNKYVSESDAKAHYEPRVKSALHFLSNHPAFKEQHAAHKQKFLEDYDLDKQRELEKISGKPIYPGSSYSAPELLNAIKNPEENVSSLNDYYPNMNGWLTETEKAIAHHGNVPKVINKAQGGNVQPSLEQMRMALMSANKAVPNMNDIRQVGANEAPGMDVKAYVPASKDGQGQLPIGGVDLNPQQPGQQLLPANMAQPQPQAPQAPQAPQGMPSPLGAGTTPPPPQGGSNILQMTPQGQAMAAMKPPQPAGMAMGGAVDPSIGTDHSPSVPYMTQGGITHLDLDDTQQLAKGGRAEKPLHYEPSPSLSKAEINAMAERMVRQMTGLDNPNAKTLQQIAREKDLPIGIKSSKKEDVPVINYEDLKGTYSVGVPGDTSRGGVKPTKSKKMGAPKAGEYLESIGGEKLDQPVGLYGGKDYGAYGHPAGWASDLSASAGMFNVVKRLAEENPERDVYGHYHKMSPEALNHAMHMLDAVLAHHKPHASTAERIALLNELMRKEKTTTSKHDVPYPEFPGFENPEDIRLQAPFNSGMRKKIIGLLGKEKYFPGGKQKLDDIIYAISHPELRNIETGAGGSSIIKFDPSRSLKESISPHPTYGHDIPSRLVGRTRYTTPAELLAPRSMYNAKKEIKAMGKKVVPFNQAKMNIIREPIDEQYINQMGEYEMAMKKRLGYKKGGKVKMHADMDTINLELSNKRKKAK